MGGSVSCPCMCARRRKFSKEMVHRDAHHKVDACPEPCGGMYEHELVAGSSSCEIEEDIEEVAARTSPKDLFVNVHVTDMGDCHALQVFSEMWPNVHRVDIVVDGDGYLFFNYDRCGQIRRHSI